MKNISRRDFLKGSAASALSLALLGGSQLAFAENETAEEKVKADETLETPILIFSYFPSDDFQICII